MKKIYIIGLLLVVLMVFVGCTKEQATEETPEQAAVQTEEVTPVQDTVETQEVAPMEETKTMEATEETTK